jgi:AraC-like DNA-binding protein
VSARGFSSLSYRKSGRISICAGGETIVSEENTLTFVPGGCDYFTEVLEGGEMILLHYRIAEGCEDLLDRPTLISPDNSARFLELFSRALSHERGGDECACMSDAYRLLSEVCRELSLSRAQPSPSLKKVKQYMDENLTSSELRISHLARLHKTSEAYFRREFKRYYSESPIEYIKRRRIEIACNLLSTDLYSITDVASYSGFDSVSYFSSEFKRYMNCSPKEYRNMQI